MRYVDYTPGPAENLFFVDGPVPVPEADEVLIQVHAAGVNRPDISQRTGSYPPPPGANPVLGLEIAGVISAVGSHVRKSKVGDAVCALTNGGGYAEFCKVPETQCLPIPHGLNFIQAASLPECFFTVWNNVFLRGHLKKAETLLVHGGASGIGSCAIQLAKAFGATVVVTVGGEEKRAYCKSLKADAAINYHTEDFEQEVLRFTQGRGVDVVLDMIGGDYFPKNLALLTMDGRLVQIATLKGQQGSFNIQLLMKKRLTLTGSSLRPLSKEAKGAIAADLLEKVWPLFAQKKIVPTIYASMPLKEAVRAHRLLESSQVCGKIILTNFL